MTYALFFFQGRHPASRTSRRLTDTAKLVAVALLVFVCAITLEMLVFIFIALPVYAAVLVGILGIMFSDMIKKHRVG